MNKEYINSPFSDKLDIKNPVINVPFQMCIIIGKDSDIKKFGSQLVPDHLHLVFTAILLLCTNQDKLKIQLQAKLYVTISPYRA